MLRRRGRNVEVCSSSALALERICAGERFDVVILDCRMPGLSGVELYRRARLVWPEIKERVIFVSGGLSPEDVSFIREHALPFFTKPLDRGGDELEQAVRALVARVSAA
jgi:DNA-binding response OmpR family regulator